MKIYQIIILFSLIVIISSGCKDIDPTGKKDCWDKLSDEEKKKYSYCCYYHGKNFGIEIKTCSTVTKEEYKDIKSYIDTLNALGDVYELDCKSNYLNISLLFLIALLF